MTPPLTLVDYIKVSSRYKSKIWHEIYIIYCWTNYVLAVGVEGGRGCADDSDAEQDQLIGWQHGLSVWHGDQLTIYILHPSPAYNIVITTPYNDHSVFSRSILPTLTVSLDWEIFIQKQILNELYILTMNENPIIYIHIHPK